MKPTYEELERRVKTLEAEIVQQRLAEKALRKSEEYYRSLFENNPVETITVDDEGRVTGYNLARKRSGRRLPEIGCKMYRDYASKHFIDMYAELMDCIQTGKAKEFPEQKYKGQYLYINMAPFEGGAIITSRNMTAWKAAEASLQENEKRYRSLFENNPMETITVDHQGRVTGYNLARKRVGDRLPGIGDVMYIDYASHHEIDMHKELMDCILTGTSKEFPERKYGDRYLYVNMAAFEDGAIIISKDITYRILSEKERDRLILDLKDALKQVKKLSGLLPICSSCKRIRDDNGYWNQIEGYIRDHSEADFSHGICPQCMEKLYPELMMDEDLS